MVKYSYNAFGIHSITYDNSGVDLGNINPFRFKGYYYDKESEMYYCQSRYYVPEWGRWLNADSPAFLDFESLNGMNLYAYCGNDPILGVDTNGAFDNERFLKGLFIVLAATLIVTVSVTTLGAGSAVCGVIVGGTLGAAGELFSQAVVENKSFEDVNYWQVAVSGVSGAISSLPGIGLGLSTAVSFASGSLNSFLGGERDAGNILLAGAKSAAITAVAGLATRCIGLGKISKLDKGNYAKKKLFLKSQNMHSLTSFNPAINKQQGLIRFITDQVGVSGLMKVANNAAGFAVNTLGDVASSAIEMIISIL